MRILFRVVVLGFLPLRSIAQDACPSPCGEGQFDEFAADLDSLPQWDAEAGFSALYLKVPDRRLTLILLSNGEGWWWENPLDEAAVESSPFAWAFLDRFSLISSSPFSNPLRRHT